PLELTVVPRDGGLALHLTGTDFFERIEDPSLEATRPYWDQPLVSENAEVYRAEHLAAQLLFDAEEGRGGLSLHVLKEAMRAPSQTATGAGAGASHAEEPLLAQVRQYAQDRYDEGYERGVHDVDAAKILAAVMGLRELAGLLRFAPSARANAQLF